MKVSWKNLDVILHGCLERFCYCYRKILLSFAQVSGTCLSVIEDIVIGLRGYIFEGHIIILP